MAHPCSSKKPPAWCNKKPRRKSGKKAECKCPSGWKTQGIMCRKGRKLKRSSCAAKPPKKK